MIAALVARDLTTSLRRGLVHLLALTQAALALALVALGEQVVQQAVPGVPPLFGAPAPASATSGPLAAIASSVDDALFVAGTLWLLLFCLVVAPAVAGPAIARERERGTLEVLLGTGATPLGIVVAKLLSTLAQVAIVLLVSLPALGLVYVFGEIAPGLAIGGLALVAGWGLVVSAMGILWSAIVRSSAGAVAATVAGAVALFAATLAAPPLALHLGLRPTALVYRLNPLLGVLTLQPDLGRRLLALLPPNPWAPAFGASPAPLDQPWLPFAAGCLALAAALALLAVVAVGRAPARA